jgi:hypothetical protein
VAKEALQILGASYDRTLDDATKTATGADFETACQAMTEWALTNCVMIPLFQRNKQIRTSSSVIGLVMPFVRDDMQFAGVYKQRVSAST